MLNKTTKELLTQGKALPLMEDFYTLQGEGKYAGCAAYFIRLGGCDVGCHWCDVKESWKAENHPILPIEEIVGRVIPSTPLVVITGGEPLMWNLDLLTHALKEKGFQINIETSGSHPLSGEIDWICLSPKKRKRPLPEILPLANELKMVIYNRHDLKEAVEYANLVSDDCLCYLQPEWSKRESIVPLIIDFIKENPTWRLSLQTHKYIDIP